MHFASNNGHVNVINVLLQNGADQSIKNSNHKTAEEIAVSHEVANVIMQFPQLQLKMHKKCVFFIQTNCVIHFKL